MVSFLFVVRRRGYLRSLIFKVQKSRRRALTTEGAGVGAQSTSDQVIADIAQNRKDKFDH
jgi:hypothetical protein